METMAVEECIRLNIHGVCHKRTRKRQRNENKKEMVEPSPTKIPEFSVMKILIEVNVLVMN